MSGAEVTSMRRIGIMGGTFNPIHIGHLTLAEWARDALELKEVWFIPTGSSYMKSEEEILPAEERLHMTQLAVSSNRFFGCLDMEIRREGPSYSHETLAQLKACFPEDNFYFIVGADCLFSIENWKNPESVFAHATLVAAVRGETKLSELKKKKRDLEAKFPVLQISPVILLPFMGMSVSSTQIRQRIRDGQSVRYLVPDNVIAYIKEKNFYQSDGGQCEKNR